jgi:ribosome-binding protein aMBF1 (putative translation factor)
MMLDTTYHGRRRARRLADPERRREYDMARAEIAQVNDVVRELDLLREEAGLSKAQLARDIDRNDAVVRRLFTADVNPELRMVAQVAARLGARVAIVRDEDAPGLATIEGVALANR